MFKVQVILGNVSLLPDPLLLFSLAPVSQKIREGALPSESYGFLGEAVHMGERKNRDLFLHRTQCQGVVLENRERAG